MKYTQRGYWVSKTYKWLSVCHWVLYSVYFRTLTYFSVANPCIHLGGMLDERKSDIYKQVPRRYLPKMKLYRSIERSEIIEDITKHFSFPIIAKPNIGFRGFLVAKIDSVEELKTVINRYKGKELLIQEYLAEAHEYSVMYYRLNNREYGISSLVEKHFPVVLGDGKKAIKELILDFDNPYLNKEWALKKNKAHLNKILIKGQKFLIDHVGNQARGSTFENLHEHIDKELCESIHSFFSFVPGMHFCRLDVKAESMQDLKSGRFKLLEINGAKSEPIHIYDPRMSMNDVIKATHEHWRTLFRIVQADIDTTEIPSSLQGIKSYFSLNRMIS